MSQFITRNEVEDLCEQGTAIEVLRPHAGPDPVVEHAQRTRNGARLARNGRGGAEPQAGREAALSGAEVLVVGWGRLVRGGPTDSSVRLTIRVRRVPACFGFALPRSVAISPF